MEEPNIINSYYVIATIPESYGWEKVGYKTRDFFERFDSLEEADEFVKQLVSKSEPNVPGQWQILEGHMVDGATFINQNKFELTPSDLDKMIKRL